MKINTIEKPCVYCNNTFTAKLKEHLRGNAKYCSKDCFYKQLSKDRSLQTEDNCTCSYCGNSFHKSPSKIKEFNFCSRKCKDTAQKIGSGIPIQPSHYGEELASYRAKAFQHYEHKCAKCGYDEYTKVLQVHHKDCNRENNEIDNLIILCPTCHCVEHYVVLKQPLVEDMGIEPI